MHEWRPEPIASVEPDPFVVSLPRSWRTRPFVVSLPRSWRTHPFVVSLSKHFLATKLGCDGSLPSNRLLHT